MTKATARLCYTIPMRTSLLQTKLYVPHIQPGFVARPRLTARLADGVAAPRALTLVSAPAGYGKSSLAAAWVRAAATSDIDKVGACAWLSLDEEDDAPERFFTYLLAALRTAGVDVRAAEAALLGFTPADVDGLTTTLLNDLARREDGAPLLVVLDDYHRITAPSIHRAMQFWLDHAPPRVHLILLTREDPPFNLARLRARNQLTELRAHDLRFTPDEAATFLNDSMQLGLTGADLSVLAARTEGWIAGLQLAALALQTSPPDAGDTSAFIAAFGGSHFYVIDYLLEEVLRRQDAAMRTFLRQTAVLDRLCAPLCDAVTGRDDSAARLTYLERRNLFLIPLDNRRIWYRYHHLLADSLRALLDEPERAQLHRRAAGWYAANGHPAAAVRHALASGDTVFAADTMAQVIQHAAAWSQGEVARLTGWLDALPTPLLHARPALCLHASRALYLAGDLTRAAHLLQEAEDALADVGTPAARADVEPAENRVRLRALATVYRAAMSALRGEQLAAAVTAVAPVLAARAATDPHTAARAADTLGLAHELTGNVTAAAAAYLDAARLAQAAGVRYLAVNAHCEAALVQIVQGDLAQAEATCRAALAAADGDAIPPTGLAWTVLGEIARERDDLAQAAEHLAAGIELGQAGGITDDLRHAYLFLAHLRQDQGDAAGALDAWRQADRLLRRYAVPRLAALAAAHRARLDLVQGNVEHARRWAAAAAADLKAGGHEYLQEFETLTLARVLLVTGEPARALDHVQAVQDAADAGGRLRTVMEVRLLNARALHALGRTDAATTELGAALALAAPAGFTRLCRNEASALAPLLPAVRDRAPAFVDDLLDHLPDAGVAGAVPVSPPDLVEPLSERELEVLRLLVDGCSNQEIADALVITLGTAKWHVHNIYQKLGVGSRAEAIARAHTWPA